MSRQKSATDVAITNASVQTPSTPTSSTQTPPSTATATTSAPVSGVSALSSPHLSHLSDYGSSHPALVHTQAGRSLGELPSSPLLQPPFHSDGDSSQEYSQHHTPTSLSSVPVTDNQYVTLSQHGPVSYSPPLADSGLDHMAEILVLSTPDGGNTFISKPNTQLKRRLADVPSRSYLWTLTSCLLIFSCLTFGATALITGYPLLQLTNTYNTQNQQYQLYNHVVKCFLLHSVRQGHLMMTEVRYVYDNDTFTNLVLHSFDTDAVALKWIQQHVDSTWTTCYINGKDHNDVKLINPQPTDIAEGLIVLLLLNVLGVMCCLPGMCLAVVAAVGRAFVYTRDRYWRKRAYVSIV